MSAVPERWDKFIIPEPNSGCWLWIGYTNKDGYGRVTFDGKTRNAHVVIYKLCGGQIPTGYELDHKCRLRCCVNPLHLDPVTHRENMLRGVSFATSNARKTHCLRGHLLSPDNLRKSFKSGRMCRECDNANARRRYHAKKGKSNAI